LFQIWEGDCKEDLADVWGKRALERCKDITKNKRKFLCSYFQLMVEDAFDNYAMNLANAVALSTIQEVFERAETEPFKSSGVRILNTALIEIMDKDTFDEESMKNSFQGEFSGWMLKLAAGDRSGLGMNYPEGYDPETGTITPRLKPKIQSDEL